MKISTHNYSMPKDLSQNDQLPIRIVSPDFGHLPKEASDRYKLTRRLPYYFLLFLIEGAGRDKVDMDEFEIGKNELLFSLPHQVQHLQENAHGTDYFKVGFDSECLSRLPKQYPFLLNPLNQHKLTFSTTAAARLRSIFEILKELLSMSDTDPELTLAHLNSLLTEINTAYFAGQWRHADDRMAKFIGFKLFVENNYYFSRLFRKVTGKTVAGFPRICPEPFVFRPAHLKSMFGALFITLKQGLWTNDLRKY